MARKPKRAPTPPDGEPTPAPADRDATGRSTVSEAQDPKISGAAGKRRSRRVADEAGVDEAGQIRKQDKPVDLLH